MLTQPRAARPYVAAGLMLIHLLLGGCATLPAEAPQQSPATPSPSSDRNATEAEIRWMQALYVHMASKWIRPPGTRDDLVVRLEIRLLPDGRVTNVEIRQRSTDPKFDDSVVTAILRASPLPLPDDSAAFRDKLRPSFSPGALEYLRK